MAERPRISRTRWIFLALLSTGLISAVAYIGWGQLRQPDMARQMTTSIYDCDTALEQMPEKLLTGLLLLRPEELVNAPIVDGFISPIGASNGAMSYDAQSFGAPNPKRGGQHCGQDLNGIGGCNTDEGEPVRAAGRGLVVYSGTPSPDWGNVVVLAHRLPGDARVIQTLYAHLKEIHVKPGQFVPRGYTIGSIGTANGHYLAHLHFEAISSVCGEAGMPGYSAKGVMNRLDPEELFTHHPAPPIPDPYGSVRRLRQREAALQNNTAPQTIPGADENTIPISPSQFL